MMNSVSIDVVVPTFRLNEQFLLPILNLTIPENTNVRFYLICDDPNAVLSENIKSALEPENISLHINAENKGAAFTRNLGINLGSSSWILFLDDDVHVASDLLITYSKTIQNYRSEIGFIGLIRMPKPETWFARTVEANGSMSIFSVAEKEKSYSWGASANIMLSRKAIGYLRFSENFPNSGGGEEVDFFLRVREKNQYRNYFSLPEAYVTHPWWNNGKADFKRFFRYGKGNSLLTVRNPQYAFHDFFNTSETIFLLIIPTIIISLLSPTYIPLLLVFFITSISLEFIISIMRVKRKIHKIDFFLSLSLLLLRNIYEAGILLEHLKKLQILQIGKRFNFDARLNPPSFPLNRYKITKLIFFLVIITWAYFSIST